MKDDTTKISFTIINPNWSIGVFTMLFALRLDGKINFYWTWTLSLDML